MPSNVKLKIVGHELVTINVKVKKGTVEERDRLKVKLRGVAGDKKTTMVLMTAPDHRDEYPLGEICVLAFRIDQQRMPLEDGKAAKAKGSSASASAH